MTPFPSEPQPRDESAAFLTRRLSPHDLEAAIALFRDSYPERSEEAQQWITGGSASSDLAWVAVTRLDGVVIGSGRCWRVEGDRFRVELVVDRAWRRRGVGTRLLEQLMAAVSREGGATLQARARADWTDSLTFLEHRGFNETMRMESSVLALDHIDPRVLARAVDREEQLEANGIRVATFATEARSDTKCWTRLAELQAAAQIGWRDPDPRPEQTTSPVTGDDVRHSYESLGFVPEALFLAVVDNGDGLRYAGSGTASFTVKLDIRHCRPSTRG